MSAEDGRDGLVAVAGGGSQSAGKWREEDGVIRFAVTSDGTTGPQWVERLQTGGFRIDEFSGSATRSLLVSPEFRTTSGVTTEIAVLKGDLFDDDRRIFKDICAEGARRGLARPGAETACLIREAVSDEALDAMGLAMIVVLHEPIRDSDGDPCVLTVLSTGSGKRLGDCFLGADLERWWDSDAGFAFASR